MELSAINLTCISSYSLSSFSEVLKQKERQKDRQTGRRTERTERSKAQQVNVELKDTKGPRELKSKVKRVKETFFRNCQTRKSRV